jgi:hypothetical protein
MFAQFLMKKRSNTRKSQRNNKKHNSKNLKRRSKSMRHSKSKSKRQSKSKFKKASKPKKSSRTSNKQKGAGFLLQVEAPTVGGQTARMGYSSCCPPLYQDGKVAYTADGNKMCG